MYIYNLIVNTLLHMFISEKPIEEEKEDILNRNKFSKHL